MAGRVPSPAGNARRPIMVRPSTSYSMSLAVTGPHRLLSVRDPQFVGTARQPTAGPERVAWTFVLRPGERRRALGDLHTPLLQSTPGAQLVLEDLAGRVQRERVDDRHPARHLVVGHALPAPGDERVAVGVPVRPQHHVRHADFAEPGIGNADDGT